MAPSASDARSPTTRPGSTSSTWSDRVRCARRQPDLSAGSYDRVVEVAELLDIVRGYEGIKEANIAQFRERAQHLLGQ